ncbi:1-(5-phosphoribosyl)-5-[(5-phosphoribosylamino)methylideneamino] imidazole-4-carboxamide isomerase [Smittium mucronatum]|uniref:1-(5-phosphoribosyl)-5-[(5-phosphoribosylamino)methylideneamino] imidazole-4-carboxamide isomerase n=1 Tax=Smittium mucronatum TaxID=133383 RepID=A0A1R0H7C3_9FUNG|nr:1-(5-phosphoribosyl)-5-[(5-phosphoribosylamino)methylideneamino] imidazole-4-carboxamide isomerase [Smittium mucronatum]
MTPRPKTKFKPCIDLHDGHVKQIVGGSLNDSSDNVKTNFVSSKPSSYYADLYKKHNLVGGHVIKLGSGNDSAATEALKAWPKGLQIGGGINIDNAKKWLDLGASLGDWVNIPTTYAGGASGRFSYIFIDLINFHPFNPFPKLYIQVVTLSKFFLIDFSDLKKVDELSNGKVDLTIGRCLKN